MRSMESNDTDLFLAFHRDILFKNLLHLSGISEQGIIILVSGLILAYIVVTGLKHLINNLSQDLEKASE